MSNLETIHEILFLGLRPWLNEESDNKIREKLVELHPEQYRQHPLLEVKFLNPLTNFRKYYALLIENDVKRFLNAFHNSMEGVTSDKEKNYLVHIAVRKLNTKLRQTKEALEKNEYEIDLKNPSVLKAIPVRKQDEAFAIQYLKHQLIRLYLEIQKAYPDYTYNNEKTEEELYFQIFLEQVPEPSLLKEPEQPVVIKEEILPPPAPASIFKYWNYDFRGTAKGVIPFNSIVKNPVKFELAERALFDKGFIDEQYVFIDSKGKKQELAALYHLMVKMGYFNDHHFSPTRKKIKPVDIRKFLDYRYKADLEQQFRRYDSKPEELSTILSERPWLTIPALR